MEKTITEEMMESSDRTRMTRRIIDGHRCYLRLSTYNKEEARAELQYWRDAHSKDDWSRKRELVKMTVMRTSSGKLVFLVWSCFRR